MAVLAHFPENGIDLDTTNEPSASECRVALVVVMEEAERSERMMAALASDANLSPEVATKLTRSKRNYLAAAERIASWMRAKGYLTSS